MKLACYFAFATFLLLGSPWLAYAQDAGQKPPEAFGGLVTLYQLDPVTQSFDFTDNRVGGIIKDHRVLAHGGEIDFGVYRADSLNVAISNGSTGRIIDLGTSKTLRAEYGCQETVGEGQTFASIHRKGASFLIRQRKDKKDDSEYQELGEGVQLLTNPRQLDSAPVILGHIYLLHVIQTEGRPGDIFVKLMVVAYQPDQSVTFRWEIMMEE